MILALEDEYSKEKLLLQYHEIFRTLFFSKYVFLEQQFKEQLPQICGYDRPFERTHLDESMSYEIEMRKEWEINRKIDEELHAMERWRR